MRRLRNAWLCLRFGYHAVHGASAVSYEPLTGANPGVASRLSVRVRNPGLVTFAYKPTWATADKNEAHGGTA